MLHLTKHSQRLANTYWSRQVLCRYSAATSRVIELSSDSHITKAIASDKLSVVDFTAKWCGPCKMIAPVYEKMSTEASFYKIDIDNPDVQTSVSSYDISAVPTFKFFKGGAEVDKIIGPDVKTLWALLHKHVQT